MSAIAVIGVVLAFPAAFIARRMGLKNVILLSVACLGVGSALGGATADLNVLMASRLLEGVGIGLIGVRVDVVDDGLPVLGGGLRGVDERVQR